jgi:purine-binding chemotaxis protein CheW
MDSTPPHAKKQASLADALALRRELGDDAIAEIRTPDVDLLCVRLHDRRYGIPINQVAEVLPPAIITRVPHMPSHIRGVFNRGGKVTAVLDLAIYSGIESEPSPRRMVVVSHGALDAAIPVSDVVGILHIHQDDIEPPIGHAKNETGFVTGQVNGDDGVLSVLDARVLLENSRVRTSA